MHGKEFNILSMKDLQHLEQQLNAPLTSVREGKVPSPCCVREAMLRYPSNLVSPRISTFALWIHRNKAFGEILEKTSYEYPIKFYWDKESHAWIEKEERISIARGDTSYATDVLDTIAEYYGAMAEATSWASPKQLQALGLTVLSCIGNYVNGI
ncbi:uncharacterized protein LOC112084653 [Eutrema salsugineum]|uniref:uncharacterized protein LOC112084653 n=1 Tax=Eutrema salsugineum TaxID=72664 RepID=UPI000CED4AB0|nr:uncharacterized protein LOC112084653 [Eutrema salsugineum]